MAFTLDACSGVKPKSDNTFGVTSVSGSLHSEQVFLASLWANTSVQAALIKYGDTWLFN